jgi:hypothetical protein
MGDKPKDQPGDEHERPEEERPGPALVPPPHPEPPSGTPEKDPA